MLLNEVIKIFSNKILLYVILIALLLNGGMIYWQQNYSCEEYEPTYEDYNDFNEQLKMLSDQDKLEYIKTELDKIDIFSQADAILKMELYEEMLSEIEPVVSYSENIQAIKKNSERLLKRLDADENSFYYERVMMSMETYEGMENVEPYHQPSRGVNLFFDNVFTDALVVLCVLFTVVIAITYEREKNLLILSKCAKYGKHRHAVVKICVVLVVGLMVMLILNIETLIMASCFYELGDMTRPIQSVAGYSLCAIETSVLGYMFIYIIVKLLFISMCAAFFYLICCIFRRAFSVYIVSAGIVVGLVTAYGLIPNASYLINLKHFNPVSFGRIEDMFSQLQCINIFGHAFDKAKMSLVCMIVLTVAMFIGGILVYVRKSEREVTGFLSFGFVKRNRYHTSVFGHEFYKTFVVQRVALIHIVGLLVAYGIFSTQNINLVGDYYQKIHSDNVMGKYDATVDDYIEKCLANVNKKKESYEGSMDDITYLGYVMEENALQTMEQYAQYLDMKPDSYYVYNLGYNMLIGNSFKVKDFNVMLSVASAVIAVIAFTASVSIDYQRGEDKLIRSTVHGKKKYIIAKYTTGIITCIVIFCSLWLPTLIDTIEKYGTEYIDAPAYSLQHLSWLPGWVTIGGYIAFIYAVRFIGLLIIMLATFRIAKKLRSNSLTVLVAAAIFVGPLILYLLGIDEMIYLTVFWIH